MAASGVLRAALLVLAGVAGTVASHAAVLKGPYLLYPGESGAMTVLWQLDSTEPCLIEWGTNLSYSAGSQPTIEYGGDHQHRMDLSGLVPSTKYYYRVHAAGGLHSGSFVTSPAADATHASFLAYGDSRSYPARYDQANEALLNEIAADPRYQTFTLHSGDIVNKGNLEADWQDQHFNRAYPNTLELQANLPIQAVLGNHDKGSGQRFTKYLPYPYVDNLYWSFDWGPAHVVVIDQYYASYADGSAQHTWLTNDLANTSRPWKFMIVHEPGWSAGIHPNNVAVQDYLQPVCEAYGVSILFAGHCHNYARADVNGVVHITAGGAGAPLYTVYPDWPYVLSAAKTYHYCTIDIAGDTLTFASKALDGSVLDAFTVVRGPQLHAAFAAGSSGGEEAISLVELAVQLDAGSAEPVTVDYAVTGGTAEAGVDFVLAGGTLTFDAGLTNATIGLSVVNDNLDEPAETVVVALSNPAGAELGVVSQHTYTINDDDTAYVQFVDHESALGEEAGSLPVSVRLESASASTVTVAYAVTGGTANAGEDYHAPLGGTLTFAPGVTNRTVLVTAVDDAVAEGDETVDLSLTDVSGAAPGSILV
ncbi:MAG: metallophosphoesterase, partial [Kiritimatiellae bacterium]|nr:metallophosphoesterase [Kiritimatiellia bacterium]